MGIGDFLELFQGGMVLVFKIAGPLLLASILVGLVIAIFQAATQIHEQTLTFVPKLLTISLILLIFGSSMMNMMKEFFESIFEVIADV